MIFGASHLSEPMEVPSIGRMLARMNLSDCCPRQEIQTEINTLNCGENFRQKESHIIGLSGHTVNLRVGEKKLRGTYNMDIFSWVI